MSTHNQYIPERRYILLGVAGVVALVLLIGFFKSLHTIDAGDEGVVTCFGQATTTLDPGLNLAAPWCGVEGINARTQTYVMVARGSEGAQQGDDSLGVQSNDNVGLSVDAGVIYHLNRERARDIYVRFKGESAIEDVLRNTSRRVIRDAAAPYAAEALIGGKRAEFGAAAKEKLVPALADYGVTIETVEIRDVRPLSESYKQAISAKVEQQQRAQAKTFELEAAQKDVEIKTTQAKGDADAQSIRNSVPPDARLLQNSYIAALRETQNKVIITDGRTPVLIQPGG